MARKKTSPEWIEIGHRVKVLIDALGWTQAKMAESIGISRSHLSGIISGGPPPSVEVAKRMRRLTGITLDWLYVGEPSSLPSKLHDAIQAIEVAREKQERREHDHPSRGRPSFLKAS